MKAVVANRLSDIPDMTLEERSQPQLKPGHSLVKVHAATVNPLSELVRSGKVPHAVTPLVLSNDGAGTIESSDQFSPGTPVAIYGGGQLGITEDGLQQQWVMVENKRLFDLPSSVNLDEASAIPINYVTAYQSLTRVGNVGVGHTVLISGASGALGHALVQISLALGATPIAVVSSASKVESAIESGADHVIDLSSQDLSSVVYELTDGVGVDFVFDVVGGALLGPLVQVLRRRGTAVSIGFVGGDTAEVKVSDLVVEEKCLHGYDAWLETDQDVAKAFDALRGFISSGMVRPRIDSRYPIDQYDAAYKRLASREARGAILLAMWE
ncbi:quinone oxidoreductase family protein [Salinicola rhizosphaerae]|uniref:NADPH:quinone reductase n=1 Tax=Salinicola rhizosphaerae TaxID=1443141 RepID=A0ABQ3EJR5_9GAMM|nr:zinc-binding alcohol dehydrogenase family protein [Salinicola rhizosphaerae]GHB34607.1 NADPH:quinone reductase [Salinicola rhizosphaerae]